MNLRSPPVFQSKLSQDFAGVLEGFFVKIKQSKICSIGPVVLCQEILHFFRRAAAQVENSHHSLLACGAFGLVNEQLDQIRYPIPMSYYWRSVQENPVEHFGK